MKDRVCWKCNKLYTPNSYSQKFCGSRREKKGCSYLVYREDNVRHRDNWSKKHPDKIKEFAKRNNARKTRMGYWKTEKYRAIGRIKAKKRRAKLKNKPLYA